jgi:hypothetical protein
MIGKNRIMIYGPKRDRHSLLKANRRVDAEAMWPVWSLITWPRFGGGLYRSIHFSLLKVLGKST